MPPTPIHRRPRGRSPNTVSRAREPGPTHLPAPTLRHLPGACLCRQGSLPRTAAEDFANPVRPGAPFPGSPSSVSAAPFPPGVSRMLWAQYTCMPVPTRASVSPLRAGPPGPGPTAHSLAGGPREATTALQACRLSTAPAVQEEGDQSQEACEGGCLCPLGPTGSLLAQAEVSGQVRALRGPAPIPPPHPSATALPGQSGEAGLQKTATHGPVFTPARPAPSSSLPSLDVARPGLERLAFMLHFASGRQHDETERDHVWEAEGPLGLPPLGCSCEQAFAPVGQRSHL